MSNESVIQYVIDASDEICFVGLSWHPFAMANDGEDLAGSKVLGRSLWNFIADEPTRQLYRQIVARVRQGRNTRFTFRCDSPSCRRLLEMSIRARPDRVVEFETRVLSAEPREPAVLLALGSARSADLLRLCAWCNRINVGSGSNLWLEVEEATARLMLFERDQVPQLSHGICEECLETMLSALASAHPCTTAEVHGHRREGGLRLPGA